METIKEIVNAKNNNDVPINSLLIGETVWQQQMQNLLQIIVILFLQVLLLN